MKSGGKGHSINWCPLPAGRSRAEAAPPGDPGAFVPAAASASPLNPDTQGEVK